MKIRASLLLVITVFSFAGCKKSGCWKCTTRQVNSDGILFGGAAARFTECGKSETEIRQLEKERSGVQTYTNSTGTSTSSTIVTTCK